MKRPSGFGLIAVLVILVMLAGMAAAIVSISTSQQSSSAQDVLAARAWQAARAGNEWGLYQALRNNQCAASSSLDLRADTGFYVTVSCAQFDYNEGESTAGTPQPVTFYQITSVACPSSTCPDAAAVAGQGYVERTRVVLASR